MPWALKFPGDSGNANTNNKLVQITGIVGSLATIRYTLHESMPAFLNRARYIYDNRRVPDSIADGGGTVSALLQQQNATVTQAVTSAWKINGANVTASALFGTIAAGSVCEFNVGAAPSFGCIAFGARFNEIEHCYNLAVRNIVIIDDAGTHTIDMSSSGGTSNEFTSTDGAVTLKLFNFTGLAHWVFYSSGATYQLTAQGGTFTYSGQTAALNRGFKLAAQGGTYSYTGASASLLRGFVMDAQGGAYSYAGSDAVLRRGFKLAANGGAYSYAGADASLTVALAANPNAFHITAQISGPQNISAMIGGTLRNNAKIGGNMTISARLSQ